MKLAMISFTQRGSRLNESLSRALSLQGCDCTAFAVAKYAEDCGLEPLTEPLADWTRRMFTEMDALLFIGATGIAVRSIAPCVNDKLQDPAVVVMDEKGMFAISLLSGHVGGANELTAMLANLTGAIPVITTATDVNGRFAVDVFAKKNALSICEREIAKLISAKVLDEEKIGLFCEAEVIGEIPEELSVYERCVPGSTGNAAEEISTGICVSVSERPQPYRNTLHLIPNNVVLGIGCKRGTPLEKIEAQAEQALFSAGVSMKAVCAIASIDLKAEEEGLLAFAKKTGLPFLTFSAEELQAVNGEFSASAFVQSITGVDNVCERSAMLAVGEGGRLIQKKTAQDGVTVALAMKHWEISF
ncbi:MAG: cobalt-precorrin 5A hydrolase [Eubacteriales bacterium]|nr:cobalt-precorrin 5A hydrolase [Eubacteriales bacterium]